jgi:uncharacterized membrane protein
MTQELTANRTYIPPARLQRWALGLGRRWLAGVNLFLGILFALPWLAPVLMKVGATGLGLLIYTIYSPLCHQFANRSFFLFGPQSMYAYTELLPYAPGANAPLGLKACVGTAELGYKVAWSDRMVSMYGGVLLGGLIFGLVRRRLRAPKWWALALMALPMVLDGVTHFISDLAGIGHGFRYYNGWLATLTGNVFTQSFYVGTTLGSFNSWMRLVTGLLFGLAVAWMLYPALEAAFSDTRKAENSRPPQT